ncbi:hypothetical protein ACQ4PT_018068 [Festuca glaucescens]
MASRRASVLFCLEKSEPSSTQATCRHPELGAANLFDTMSVRADDEGGTEMAVAGGEDFIGALPDDVLRYVLSFLPSRNAVRTCVLARRWRMLWRSVPALRIKDDPKAGATTRTPPNRRTTVWMNWSTKEACSCSSTSCCASATQCL